MSGGQGFPLIYALKSVQICVNLSFGGFAERARHPRRHGAAIEPESPDLVRWDSARNTPAETERHYSLHLPCFDALVMEILYYTDLDYAKVKKNFSKVVEYLKNGNFAGAEVRKMSNTGYYRAKLDEENRLLFKFARYEGRSYLLLLEVILHHNYRDSRFLKGAAVDESKIEPVVKPEQVAETDVAPLPYVNPRSTQFHLLDKVISFDDDQQQVFQLPTPLIVIGSAGSGKTALTLEKIKTLRGNILYVTLSPYLVENSANLYYSFNTATKTRK